MGSGLTSFLHGGMVERDIVLRTLATRGRKRGAPRRQAWGDGAKRKVRRTISLTTTKATKATIANHEQSKAHKLGTAEAMKR